jgi:hypothetical protein
LAAVRQRDVDAAGVLGTVGDSGRQPDLGVVAHRAMQDLHQVRAAQGDPVQFLQQFAIADPHDFAAPAVSVDVFADLAFHRAQRRYQVHAARGQQARAGQAHHVAAIAQVRGAFRDDGAPAVPRQPPGAGQPGNAGAGDDHGAFRHVRSPGKRAATGAASG